MIISSFQKEYGIRIYSEDFKKMKWDEFQALLAGLGSDTPLGRVIQIRSEDDPDKLKYYTENQLRIRSEWQRRIAMNTSKEERDSALGEILNAFKGLAGGE